MPDTPVRILNQLPLYKHLARLLDARENCDRQGNQEWHKRHTDQIEQLVKDYMPSGSGFDNGTSLDFDRSRSDRLVFLTSYHHMNDGGFYDGWTEHEVIVTPSLAFGINLRITGRNRNDIKEFIHQVFDDTLRTEVRSDHRQLLRHLTGVIQ